jgi:hypothetical protein
MGGLVKSNGGLGRKLTVPAGPVAIHVPEFRPLHSDVRSDHAS